MRAPIRTALASAVTVMMIVASPLLRAQDSAFEYQGALAAVRHVPVPTVPRTNTAQLVDGGVFDCDGYKSVVLNLAGEVKDQVTKPGKIGAILVPEIEPFIHAFRQLGLLPVTIEIDVSLKPGATYYMAEPKKADLGFPRYRVLFYNESDASVTASFFAYRGR